MSRDRRQRQPRPVRASPGSHQSATEGGAVGGAVRGPTVYRPLERWNEADRPVTRQFPDPTAVLFPTGRMSTHPPISNSQSGTTASSMQTYER